MESFNDSLYEYGDSSFDRNPNFTIGFPYYYGQTQHVPPVVPWVIVSVNLPLTLVSIYTLYSLVQHDHIVPVYVINLTITDAIQLCCMIVWVAKPEYGRIYVALYYIYFFSVMASVGFIVCVALERYLVIAHPLWYHFSQPIKISVLVSVVIWLLPFVYIIPDYFIVETYKTDIIFAIFHLLPLPFLAFFLAGAIKALSAAIHITSVEKHRIIGTLVLPLIIYLLFFLPIIVSFLAKEVSGRISVFAIMFIRFTPLANSLLYVLIRKGVLDKLLASLFCKMDDNDIKTVSVSMRETREISK